GFSCKHDSDDEAVPIHDRRPHVEIEAAVAVGVGPGLYERGFQMIEAGDPAQVQVERGPADGVVVAARCCGGDSARGDAETDDFAEEGMETEHGGILRFVRMTSGRRSGRSSGSEWRRSGGIRAKASGPFSGRTTNMAR